jgi:putative aldouronate transport system permease protein
MVFLFLFVVPMLLVQLYFLWKGSRFIAGNLALVAATITVLFAYSVHVDDLTKYIIYGGAGLWYLASLFLFVKDRAVRQDFQKNRALYLMLVPVLVFYIVTHYGPMYGAIIAFKDFNAYLGITGSPWVGFKHFIEFFNSYSFVRVIRNTLTISLTQLVLGFPAPIILALLLNELRGKYFSRTVQTITYMPHFISVVVICGLIQDFTVDYGVVNQVLQVFGWKPVTMLLQPKMFVPVYVLSGIWQEVGWGSIIYLATLTGIDQQLYEAAEIDGAGRFKKLLHITVPCMLPTIVVLLILRMGGLMNIGFEKIFLLYNPITYETADVISTYVYRRGILESNFSFSSAVGLFNSAINFLMLVGANWLSKRLQGTSLW